MAKRSSSVPYRRGDWVAVPLRDEGYAVGIIVQADGAGGVTGYFFGPLRLALPRLAELRSLHSSDAIYICNFGDLGLINREWPVIGGHEEWKQGGWPIPEFGYIEGPGGPAYKVTYKDSQLSEYETRVQISIEECLQLPDDGIFGSGAVEKILTRLLNGQEVFDSRAWARGGIR